MCWLPKRQYRKNDAAIAIYGIRNLFCAPELIDSNSKSPDSHTIFSRKRH